MGHVFTTILKMVYMGRGFTSKRQESGSVFSVAVCKIQARKCYIESLPLVPKDKTDCFSQGKRSAAQLSLYQTFAQTFNEIWKPSIVITMMLLSMGMGIQSCNPIKGTSVLYWAVLQLHVPWI